MEEVKLNSGSWDCLYFQMLPAAFQLGFQQEVPLVAHSSLGLLLQQHWRSRSACGRLGQPVEEDYLVPAN